MKQCTDLMDENTYKFFQIMNHRTVGVCSALKLDQFRAVTELSVNRLLKIVETQATTMNEALKKQQQINSMSDQNILKVEEQHEKVSQGQLDIFENIQKTAEINEEIASKLQKAVEWSNQFEEQKEKLDKMTQQLETHLEMVNRQMIAHYKDSMDFLDHFKSMMDLVAQFSNKIQSTFMKLRMIMEEIGIDITAEYFVLLLINAGYFIVGMVFILFMELGSVYKNILIGLVAFNTLAAYFKSEVSITGRILKSNNVKMLQKLSFQG